MRFLQVEAAGGILLVAATIVALVWANSPWQAGYESFWATSVRVEIGSYLFEEDLGHVVNDLLMAVFFFVVGMEIKRELVVGELRDRRSVALPAMAALGGMIVPAVIYLAFNAGGEGARGWGIPMATDIAFALGVVALLGSRVPGCGEGAPADARDRRRHRGDRGDRRVLHRRSRMGPAARRPRPRRARRGDASVRVIYSPVLAIVGFALWLAVYESGVHATIAGVVMGLLTPARPIQTELEAEQIVDVLEGRPTSGPTMCARQQP